MSQFNLLSVYQHNYFTENESREKITAGEIAQQRQHLHPEGKNTLTTQKKRAASKEKDERGQWGRRKEQAFTAHMKARGKWSRVSFTLLRWGGKRALTPTRVFPLEAIQCSSEINHHDVWPHLINKWKGRTTTEKKRLIRTEAIRNSILYSVAALCILCQCYFSIIGILL